jgi:hypothetical protein
LVCEATGTAAITGLLCQPGVIVKMIVEKMECRLAGETKVLGENLPQSHFCPSQNPTWPDPVLNPVGTAVGSRRLTAWAMARTWPEQYAHRHIFQTTKRQMLYVYRHHASRHHLQNFIQGVSFETQPKQPSRTMVWKWNQKQFPRIMDSPTFPVTVESMLHWLLGCCYTHLRRRSAGTSKMYLRAERVFSFEHCIASKSSAAVCRVRRGADKFLAFPIFLFAAQPTELFLDGLKKS